MTELLNDFQFKKLQGELVQVYSAKKAQNGSFSLRAFSLKLGVSSGALTEILSGKRKVSSRTAERILKNLHFSSNQVEKFLLEKKDKSKSSRVFHDLSFDQYEVISSWQYLALLNFLELPNESHEQKNIASRLGMTLKKTKELMARLLRLEMIEEDARRYKRTFIRYKTSEDISNAAIKKYHSQTLELSEKALGEISPELRDFSSILLKMNTKNLKKIKEAIRDFQDELSEDVENDEPDEVYHLNVHLYPVTKIKKLENHKRGKNV